MCCPTLLALGSPQGARAACAATDEKQGEPTGGMTAAVLSDVLALRLLRPISLFVSVSGPTRRYVGAIRLIFTVGAV